MRQHRLAHQRLERRSFAPTPRTTAGLVGEFRDKQDAARHRRPQRDLDRLARQGKMRPRERIEKLLDPGTPFLELSSLAANMAYGGDAPSASTIVGIGVVIRARGHHPRRRSQRSRAAPGIR